MNWSDERVRSSQKTFLKGAVNGEKSLKKNFHENFWKANKQKLKKSTKDSQEKRHKGLASNASIEIWRIKKKWWSIICEFLHLNIDCSFSWSIYFLNLEKNSNEKIFMTRALIIIDFPSFSPKNRKSIYLRDYSQSTLISILCQIILIQHPKKQKHYKN